MTASPKNHDGFGHFRRLIVLNIMTSLLTIQGASIIARNYMPGSHAQQYQFTRLGGLVLHMILKSRNIYLTKKWKGQKMAGSELFE
jgi:hypothetical protein